MTDWVLVPMSLLTLGSVGALGVALVVVVEVALVVAVRTRVVGLCATTFVASGAFRAVLVTTVAVVAFFAKFFRSELNKAAT